MKILIIGDIHGKISQFDSFKRFLGWASQKAISNKVDLVVNLGDTFHNHAVLRSEIMSEFRSHIEEISAAGIPYFYIVGNHDCYKPDDMKYHALQGLVGIDRFIVVDRPSSFHGMSFVPFCADKANFPTDLNKICFCHQSFVGANYGNILANPSHPATVDSETLPCEIIYSGHVHLRSSFGNVRYPGSPFAWSASDVGQVKGVVIFDTETYQETFIPSELPMWHRTHIDLKSGSYDPIFRSSSRKEDHYILDITGTKAEIAAFLDSKIYKKDIDGYHVSVKTNPTDTEKKIHKIVATSIVDIVKKYVQNVYKGTVDKQVLVEKAMKFVGENQNPV